MEILEHIAEFERKVVASGNDPGTARQFEDIDERLAAA